TARIPRHAFHEAAEGSHLGVGQGAVGADRRRLAAVPRVGPAVRAGAEGVSSAVASAREKAMPLGKARLAALLGVVALALALLMARRRRLSPARPPAAATAPSATSHADPGAFAVRAEKGAGVIDGVVLGPEGAPMAGAALLLSRQPQSPDDDETEPVPATTDAAGRFAFPDLAAGVYLVTATSSRPGLAPAASGELAL